MKWLTWTGRFNKRRTIYKCYIPPKKTFLRLFRLNTCALLATLWKMLVYATFNHKKPCFCELVICKVRSSALPTFVCFLFASHIIVCAWLPLGCFDFIEKKLTKSHLYKLKGNIQTWRDFLKHVIEYLNVVDRTVAFQTIKL